MPASNELGEGVGFEFADIAPSKAEAALSAELADYCLAHDLPYLSADLLVLMPGVTPTQRVWLKHFCNRWDLAINGDLS